MAYNKAVMMKFSRADAKSKNILLFAEIIQTKLLP